ncbi:MAG TPA: hypothetical protein VGI81_14205 [Tepidisphaeraceae bacterium]
MANVPVNAPTHKGPSPFVQRARETLIAFLFTFMTARVLVYLIMARKIPTLYAHAGGTHIHHLNYGIFLLTFVGAILIFAQPTGRKLTLTTLLYGVGLGLTFDEFGMWLHLTVTYWQRSSFDAVVVIAAVLGLISAAPAFGRYRPHHWITGILMLLLLAGFTFALIDEGRHLGKKLGPSFQQLEENGPDEH